MKKFDLIGKTLAEVSVILADEYGFRVVKRDGIPQVATRDVREDRLNLELEDGKVVNYYYG